MRLARPVRVGVAGCGYFAGFHFDAWTRIAGAELVAVADPDAGRAGQAAERFGAAPYDDPLAMLDEAALDLLDIASPPPTHAALIEAAADRGVHVVCQKPFCGGDLAIAASAVETAEAAGIVLAVHENFRFQPWYRRIAGLIASAALGTVYNATFRLRPGDGAGPDAYLARQPYFRAMPRFLLHETGIHHIDVFRFLLGEPEAVFADIRRLNPEIAGEDSGIMMLRFPEGARALYDGNRLVDHPAENRRLTMGDMLIEGANAVLRLDGDGGLHVRAAGSNEETAVACDWADRGFGGDCVHALQAHVIAHLSEGAPLENSGRDYLKNLAILDAAYRSAAEGHWIAIGPDHG